MSIFINTHTMQYPLFEGDAKIDNAFWEVGWPLPEFWEAVTPVNPPSYNENEVCEQHFPELVDGQWKMKWVVRPKTEEEIAKESIKKDNLFGIQTN